jgi:YfiH family protein
VHRYQDPEGSNVLTPLGISTCFRAAASPPEHTVVVKQVHGVCIVDGSTSLPSQQADGIFLSKPGKIAVASADCLPILLAAPRASLLFALHAGWRSLAGGIVQEAQKCWHEQGCTGEDFYAVLGPTLCRQHFEVGPEVVKAFAAPHLGLSSPQLDELISAGAADRSHVDLSMAATMMLLGLGLSPERISVLESCTFCHPERWPSRRRDGKFDRSIWSSIFRNL